MSQLPVTAIVRAPIDTVWNMVADVGTVADWHPAVQQAPVLSPNRIGLGAKRRCEFYDGTSVVEEVVRLDEGRSLTVALSDFSMPLSRAEATIGLEPDGPERTKVTFTMDYDMKYGPAGWLMNATMLRPMMGKLLARVLAGLDHHLVTGENVGKDWVAQAA
jgi:ribosome-associated toxin RatA of RatAB toxin-antitoxin module